MTSSKRHIINRECYFKKPQKTALKPMFKRSTHNYPLRKWLKFIGVAALIDWWFIQIWSLAVNTNNIRGSQSFIKVEASIFALLFSFYHVVCLGKFIYLFMFWYESFSRSGILICLCLPYLESTWGKLLF